MKIIVNEKDKILELKLIRVLINTIYGHVIYINNCPNLAKSYLILVYVHMN